MASIVRNNIFSYKRNYGTIYSPSDYCESLIGEGDTIGSRIIVQMSSANQRLSVVFGFSGVELPEDAIITKVYARIAGYWGSSSGDPTYTINLQRDTTEYSSNKISADYTKKETSTTYEPYIVEIPATTLPSISDISAGNIYLNYKAINTSATYFGGLNGASLYIEYQANNGIFNLILPRG